MQNDHYFSIIIGVFVAKLYYIVFVLLGGIYYNVFALLGVLYLCPLLLGGDDEGGETGFLGCMRNIEIAGEWVDDIPPEDNYNVINGSCSIQDK